MKKFFHLLVCCIKGLGSKQSIKNDNIVILGRLRINMVEILHLCLVTEKDVLKDFRYL